jgi:hypothetical protein
MLLYLAGRRQNKASEVECRRNAIINVINLTAYAV